MKKLAIWLAVISFLVFVFAWSIIGIRIFDGNYDITTGAYIGLISIAVFFVCVLSIKFTSRCPHCGKWKHPFGTYCPYCGREIR